MCGGLTSCHRKVSPSHCSSCTPSPQTVICRREQSFLSALTLCTGHPNKLTLNSPFPNKILLPFSLISVALSASHYIHMTVMRELRDLHLQTERLTFFRLKGWSVDVVISMFTGGGGNTLPAGDIAFMPDRDSLYMWPIPYHLEACLSCTPQRQRT